MTQPISIDSAKREFLETFMKLPPAEKIAVIEKVGHAAENIEAGISAWTPPPLTDIEHQQVKREARQFLKGKSEHERASIARWAAEELVAMRRAQVKLVRKEAVQNG